MRARTLFIGASVGTIILTGCASPPPSIDPELAASNALALREGDAIAFRTEGAPVDEPTTAPASLSLKEAVRLSVLRSPSLQAALARVRVAQADAQQARLLPNPILNIGLRFPESGGSAIIDAGLSADLIAVLRQPGAITVADAKLRAVATEAVTAALDVATSAMERYYTVQAIEASLVVLRERTDLLQRLLDLADARLRAGEGTRLDVVTLSTQRVTLDAEIADRELELHDERLALARLIGQPSSDAGWTVDAWEASTVHASLAEQDALRLALQHRPEIQQREYALQALGAERRQANWNPFDDADVGINAERDGDWSFGPAGSVPLPLFDTGEAGRRRADALLVEAKHQLVETRRSVIEEVRRAHAMVAGTRANLDRVDRELIPLQTARLEQAEAQFKAGQTDITALLLAEQDLRAARAQRVDLQRRVAVASVRLFRSIGRADSSVGGAVTPTP